jgi:hypothetical protein
VLRACRVELIRVSELLRVVNRRPPEETDDNFQT